MAEEAEGAEGAAEEGQEGQESEAAKAAATGAEGKEGADKGAEGQEKGKDEGKSTQQQEADWRAAIKDEEARKLAEDSTDVEHLAKRALDMRKKLAKSVALPGKNASEEDVAAYRKALGIPEDPSGYKFPELAEDEMTDEVKASREAWAQRFHENGIPASAAEGLIKAFQEDMDAAKQAQIEADKKHAEEQAALLDKEWGPDAKANKTYANRAFATVAEKAGVNLEELKQIETKAGQFLMDDARMSRIFAVIGREMGEGSLGGVMTDDAREAVENEIAEVRTKANEAQAKGDTKAANKWYQKEQQLIAKMNGTKPVVGAQGRAA